MMNGGTNLISSLLLHANIGGYKRGIKRQSTKIRVRINGPIVNMKYSVGMAGSSEG